MRVPVVDAVDLLAQEQALADRALGERAELSADVVEHGALLDVEPEDASEAAIALDPEVDAPLCAVVVHDLHRRVAGQVRSEEHTSELQSLMRISYAVFCLKKKNITLFSTTIYT